MLTQAKIQQILEEQFHPVKLIVIDNSHQHADHNPAAAAGSTHFSVEIVSDAFTGKKLIERHRLVYAVLKEGLQANIHALALKTLSPDETGRHR